MDRKLKVLCFHPALAPYRVDFFNLLARQVDLKVAFLMENLKNQKLDQAAIRAQVQFKYRMLTKGFELKGRLFRFGIRRLLKETHPDVVLAYEASPIALFLCLLKKFAAWKLWTSMDEAAVTIRARRGVRAWMRDFVLRHCDGVMVPSEEAARALKEINPKIKTAVVPIIHDTATIRKNAEKVIAEGRAWRDSLPCGWQKVLLFVGRLAPVKNLAWLINQMPNLPREIGLVIVGEGSERESLERQVAELQLSDRVRFDGKHEGESVYARMSAADALILPSTFEPYGAVVGEALQWGTPCLISDRVGSNELVRESDNGFVFTLDDTSDFLKKMSNAMSLRHGNESILAIKLLCEIEKLSRCFCAA